MMWRVLRAGQPGDRVAERAGSGREPDLGELGRGLGRDAEDVPAAARIGAVARRRLGRDAGGLGGLAQTLGARGLWNP
jgi:hypothetical protein